MGVGHVPQDPVHPEGQGAHVQGRERGGTSPDRDLNPPRALTASQARGRFGESEAARWYRRHGYEELDRNWRCPLGELDLVVGRPGLVVICEVKARASADFGGPQSAVNWKKQQRLRRLAAAWLAERRPGPVQVRFDVAAVVGAKVEIIEAAF